MKTRRLRILEAVAASPAGLTTAGITDAVSREEKNGLARNSSAITWLVERGFVISAGRGRPYVITPAGRADLDQRIAAFEQAERDGPNVTDRRLGPELPLWPLVQTVSAVDGQAPRHLVNSIFNLAAARGSFSGAANA